MFPAEQGQGVPETVQPVSRRGRFPYPQACSSNRGPAPTVSGDKTQAVSRSAKEGGGRSKLDGEEIPTHVGTGEKYDIEEWPQFTTNFVSCCLVLCILFSCKVWHT